MIPDLREIPYEEKLKKLRLWTLAERRNRADLIEVFKMSKGLSKLLFEDFFEISKHGKTRGHTETDQKEVQTGHQQVFLCGESGYKMEQLGSEDHRAGESKWLQDELRKTKERKDGFFMD